MKQTKHNKGFTLVEILVAIAVFGLILFGVVFLVADMFQTGTFQSRLLDNNDQARKAATNFTNELRNATTSAAGSYSLEIVQSQQLAFYTRSGNTVIRVRYFLQSGMLYRGVVTPVGNTYNLGSEVVQPVQSAMATQPGDTIFSYYNGNFNGSGSALTQPVNPTQVTYIQIDLKIYRQGSKNATVGFYNVTAGGSIRNLKTNL